MKIKLGIKYLPLLFTCLNNMPKHYAQVKVTFLGKKNL